MDRFRQVSGEEFALEEYSLEISHSARFIVFYKTIFVTKERNTSGVAVVLHHDLYVSFTVLYIYVTIIVPM